MTSSGGGGSILSRRLYASSQSVGFIPFLSWPPAATCPPAGRSFGARPFDRRGDLATAWPHVVRGSFGSPLHPCGPALGTQPSGLIEGNTPSGGLSRLHWVQKRNGIALVVMLLHAIVCAYVLAAKDFFDPILHQSQLLEGAVLQQFLRVEHLGGRRERDDWPGCWLDVHDTRRKSSTCSCMVSSLSVALVIILFSPLLP
jgi:hypothetical protein